MNQDELGILQTLDAAIRSKPTTTRIDEVVSRVEADLLRKSGEPLAWEPIPLRWYGRSLPEIIRSSWVFVLRARTVTGAERHPNSHQRMLSYRGSGDFQTWTGRGWNSHLLRSDPAAPIEDRWISIPRNVWHQGVVPAENWVVVSFHTATQSDLIEERPGTDAPDAVRRRRYAGEQ